MSKQLLIRIGFINVLEGCRHSKVSHLVFASSSSVYGANTKLPFSEQDNVDHPVSLDVPTKKANELKAHSHAHFEFVNELAILFNRLGLDTREVLEAAGTKWNFLPFRPGLVGGHCIGVDPYYLTDKAEMIGYHPQIILAGRRINDGMGKFVAEQKLKLMV
jgi:hypothetical protein